MHLFKKCSLLFSCSRPRCPAAPMFLQEAFGASSSHPHPAAERLRRRRLQEQLWVQQLLTAASLPIKKLSVSTQNVFICVIITLFVFCFFPARPLFQWIFQRPGVPGVVEQLHRGLSFFSSPLLDSSQSHHHFRFKSYWKKNYAGVYRGFNHSQC